MIVRPDLPAAVKEPCNPPTPLPDRALRQGEVFGAMAKDRTALRACEAKRAGAVAAAEGR